ncbi:MAG: arginine--tRNA ligase [Candidatus Omnitrophica bacterium]|nr:arginine--tRNA ligase [Candidatus Omnitrophota bacterium]
MSREFKDTVTSLIRDIIKEEGLSKQDLYIDIEFPKEKQFGDWSINVAMKLAKECRKRPLDIAELLAARLREKLMASGYDKKIEKIEVKSPGYINIFFSNEALDDILKLIQEKKNDFGRSNIGNAQKILIEFVSANPTGPLSIAHARQAAVGDTLANIMSFCGYEVTREYYINDEGNQIKNLGLSLQARYLQALGRKDAELPADGYKGEYLVSMAEDIVKSKKDAYAHSDDKTLQFFSEYAATEILREINNELSDFGVSFDTWFSQKQLAQSGEINKVFAVLKDGGYLYEEDGAAWFKSTVFGDDKDRVLIKSDGQFTYLTPDIAYHRLKFARGFEKLINILGPDHHGYINRLKAAVCALGRKKDDLSVLIIQLATLFRDGKPVVMSTRAGEYITLRELMQEVGRDASRFFFLMRRCDSHLEFDLELAKKQSLENPVYYIQYAYARISGIAEVIRSGENKKIFEDTALDLALLREEETLDLIRKLNLFPEVLITCSLSLEPHGLTTYLRELAGCFHAFYNKYRVYSEENLPLSKARFVLVDCVRQVLYTGLRLVGVGSPERM